MSSYGLLSYSSINIGDEIQSVAAQRFLPSKATPVHRERISKFKSKNSQVKLIMNAWWMWEPENFPPSDDIDPLLISMHIQGNILDKFLTPETKEYLIKHGPVGCRDMGTADYLNKNGVPAYFSGCLTLTLQRNWKIMRSNYVLCVDCPNDVVQEIKKRTKRPVYPISRLITPFYTAEERLNVAKVMLYLYHNAACVVTPCLHTIMPCLAFETPVLRLIKGDSPNSKDYRFYGYEGFYREACQKDFLENKNIYNFDRPPKNPDKYKKIRKELIQKCKDFTGINKSHSPVSRHTENNILSLIWASQWTTYKKKRFLRFVEKSDLEQAITDFDNGLNRQDLKN